jgi:hypothetical protein
MRSARKPRWFPTCPATGRYWRPGSPTQPLWRAGSSTSRSGSAGAVVDALAVAGIDYSSPEAAAACAAFTGLRGAVAHLLTASVSGQEDIADGAVPAEIAAAGRLGSSDTVTVLRAPRQNGAPAAE